MSFFSRLSVIIGEEYSVQITVQKKDDNLSVSVVPKTIGDKDKEGKTIIPIVVTGTPDQIDAGLISAIAQPVASLNQLVISGQAFFKEEKKGSSKKTEEPKKAESPQKTLEPTKVIEYPKPEPASQKTENVSSAEPAETFDEDTGEVMPVSELMEEEEEVVSKSEPAKAKDPEPVEDKSQASMFDDEDWA